MAGFSAANAWWQSMHSALSGKAMVSPGSGLVWQKAHSMFCAEWVLWLNGIGCETGGGGTSFFASFFGTGRLLFLGCPPEHQQKRHANCQSSGSDVLSGQLKTQGSHIAAAAFLSIQGIEPRSHTAHVRWW